MSNKKSIIEQAILEAKEIEKAVMENAKEILTSATKEDIEEMVKESLVTEADDEEENKPEGDADSTAEELPATDDSSEFPTDDTDASADTESPEMDLDSEIGAGGDDMGGEDFDTVDLTSASDADVVKVFKKIDGTDQISVRKDSDGTLHIEDGENEYRIEMGGDADDIGAGMDSDMGDLGGSVGDDMGGLEGMEDDMGMGAEMEGAGMEDDDEMSAFGESEERIYEIQLDEDDPIMGDGAGNGSDTDSDEGFNEKKGDVIPFKGKPMKSPVSGDVVPVSEEEIDELARTHSQGRYGMRKLPETFPADKKRPAQQEQFRKNYVKMINENKVLKKNVNQFKALNEEYKKALKHFRNKLNEVAVFNTNLFYATQLFTEHSTTKDEKLTILKRFDAVKDIKESKNLYKSIKGELGTKAPIKERVENKINKTVDSGSPKQPQTIVESTVYKDSQFSRTLDLLNKLS